MPKRESVDNKSRSEGAQGAPRAGEAADGPIEKAKGESET